jgi:hypothetical protein
MASFVDLIGHPLTWNQASIFAIRPQYELCSEQQLLGTLRLKNIVTFAAVFENTDTFRFEQAIRLGRSHTVRILANSTGAVLGTYAIQHPHTRSGVLELPNGVKLRGVGHPQFVDFEFKTESGELLVRLKRLPRFWRVHTQVELMPAAAQHADSPWLIALALYLVLLSLGDPGL